MIGIMFAVVLGRAVAFTVPFILWLRWRA